MVVLVFLRIAPTCLCVMTCNAIDRLLGKSGGPGHGDDIFLCRLYASLIAVKRSAGKRWGNGEDGEKSTPIKSDEHHQKQGYGDSPRGYFPHSIQSLYIRKYVAYLVICSCGEMGKGLGRETEKGFGRLTPSYLFPISPLRLKS